MFKCAALLSSYWETKVSQSYLGIVNKETNNELLYDLVPPSPPLFLFLNSNILIISYLEIENILIISYMLIIL